MLPLLVAAQVLGRVGALTAPSESLRAYVADGSPFFGSACAGGFLLFGAHVRQHRFGPASIAIGLLLGVALDFALSWCRWMGADDHAALPFASDGAGFCIAAALVAIARGLLLRTRSDLQCAATVMLLPLFVVLSNCFLDATVLLHPAVLDPPAALVEAALSSDIGFRFARLVSSHPALSFGLTTAYVVLPLACAIASVAQTQPATASRDVLVSFAAVGIAGFLCYHLCPIIGPQPFFSGDWPWRIPDLRQSAPSGVTTESIEPRNCLPSLHAAWALVLYWHAREHGRWLGRGFLAFLLLTLLATIGLGQHYLIDLLAAFPFALAVRALCHADVPWSEATRRRALVFGATGLLAWIALVRVGATLARRAPPLVWALGIASVVATLWFAAQLRRRALPWHDAIVPDESTSAASDDVWRARARWLWIPISASGFAGLTCEVVFTKQLALTFGSTARASATVLATYLGGLALGARAGAFLARRSRRALVAYAASELLVGLSCAATPSLFPWIRRAYVAIAHGTDSSAPWLSLLQLVLGAVVVLPPAVLMGLTMPLLVRHVEGNRTGGVGAALAWLYGANTLGAACGAVVAGIAVLPWLGLRRATWFAATLDVLVGALAIGFARAARLARDGTASSELFLADNGVAPALAPQSRAAHRDRWIGYTVLFVAGIVTLALETIYTHLLAAVVGCSAYAFALMLSCFLLGIGLGSAAGRRLLDGAVHVGIGLGLAQLLIAVALLGGLFAWSGVPAYFGSFWDVPRGATFAERELVRGAVCAAILLPATIAIGVAYPLAIQLVTRRAGPARLDVLGRAMAWNATGNVGGALATTFVLLPGLGSVKAIVLLAAMCIALGCLSLATEPLRALHKRWEIVGALLLAIALLFVRPRELDWDELATGANVYFARQPFGTVVAHAESAEGGITEVAEMAVPDESPTKAEHGAVEMQGRMVRTLLTNGKFQGDDNPDGEMRAQLGFALAPLLHGAARERALVIGLGTGVSSRVVRDAGYAQVEIAELSRDVIDMAARHFSTVNDGVLAAPNVRTFVTDGRNHLLLSDEKFDLVSIEITSIWFQGESSLYTRDFYELVRGHLSPKGVLQQWLQLHRLSQSDIRAIFAAVHAVFPWIWLYVIGNQGQIVACAGDCRPDDAALDAIAKNPRLRAALAYFDGDPRRIPAERLLDTQAVEAFLSAPTPDERAAESTDDSLYLEYSTPRANVRDYQQSLDENLTRLHAFQPPSALRGTRLHQ